MRAKEICQWSTARHSTLLSFAIATSLIMMKGLCIVQYSCAGHIQPYPALEAEDRQRQLICKAAWKARLLELGGKHSQWVWKPLYRPQMLFKTPNLALAFSSIPAHIWAGFSSHFLSLYSHHLPASHSDMGTLSTCHASNLGKRFYCNSVLIQHQKSMPKHDCCVGGQMLVHKYLQTNDGSSGWIWFVGLLFFSTWKLCCSNTFQYALLLH